MAQELVVALADLDEDKVQELVQAGLAAAQARTNCWRSAAKA